MVNPSVLWDSVERLALSKSIDTAATVHKGLDGGREGEDVPLLWGPNAGLIHAPHCFSFEQARVLYEAPSASSHQKPFSFNFVSSTQSIGPPKCGQLSARTQEPIVSHFDKYEFYVKPQVLARKRSLFH